jgi:hypothetical protein
MAPSKGLAQVLRRLRVASVSRVFQSRPLGREFLLEASHYLDHEFCGLLHGRPRLVYKACLDCIPALPEAATSLASEEGTGLAGIRIPRVRNTRWSRRSGSICPRENLLALLVRMVECRR